MTTETPADPAPSVPETKSGSEAKPALLRRAWLFTRRRPYLVLVILGSTLLGAGIGAAIPFGEFSTARRCFGGAIAGFYFSLFPLGFRLFD